MELRHKGPMGEDVAEGIRQPRRWDHHRSVQDVGITYGDFRKERLIFCRGDGDREQVIRVGVDCPGGALHGGLAPWGVPL